MLFDTPAKVLRNIDLSSLYMQIQMQSWIRSWLPLGLIKDIKLSQLF